MAHKDLHDTTKQFLNLITSHPIFTNVISSRNKKQWNFQYTTCIVPFSPLFFLFFGFCTILNFWYQPPSLACSQQTLYILSRKWYSPQNSAHIITSLALTDHCLPCNLIVLNMYMPGIAPILWCYNKLPAYAIIFLARLWTSWTKLLSYVSLPSLC